MVTCNSNNIYIDAHKKRKKTTNHSTNNELITEGKKRYMYVYLYIFIYKVGINISWHHMPATPLSFSSITSYPVSLYGILCDYQLR